MSSYPTAMTASNDQQGVRRAIQWTEGQRQPGHQVLVWAPGKSNVTADRNLEAYSKRELLMTPRARPKTHWGGGPVLAAWPSADYLARLAEMPGISALCVVTWRDDDVAAWASAASPSMLTPGAAGPSSAGALDPVVVQGMETMTALVNQANHLAGIMDKRDAIAVLTVLHRAGYGLDPTAIYQWAIANGWRAAGAQRLREMATRFAAGKPMRLPPRTQWPLRDDILEQWRTRASGPGRRGLIVEGK